MQKAETLLRVIQRRGNNGKPLERVYRQLYNLDLYLVAYGNLYSNKGALTPGTDGETADGMSIKRIQQIIDEIRSETYRWKPVRRTYIPKRNSKEKRPLGMPSWSDKLLQEVMRLVLEAYYEPKFSEHSHGFRPNKGCHTALEEITGTHTGAVWFIEGDIAKYFDNINHNKLLEILSKDIYDERFLQLIQRMLEAGYIENWTWHNTYSGAPQGGVISPLFSNIYLNELDMWIENELLPDYRKGKSRQRDAGYSKYVNLRYKAVKKGDRGAAKEALKRMQERPAYDPQDANYRRLRYVRYADDFLLSFIGPREEAVEIKTKIGEFLKTELLLEMSEEKTLITHATTNAARFLGYEIITQRGTSYRRVKSGTKMKTKSRSANGKIALRLPRDVIDSICSRYMRYGKPAHLTSLMHRSDFDIVFMYGAQYRGYVQYYKKAQNLHQMNKVRWVMRSSMLKTLASKHRTKVTKILKKYVADIETPHGLMKGIRVTIPREGKNPLIAQFGGIPLRYEKSSFIEDKKPQGIRNLRTQIVDRLLAEKCEMCGSTENIEVHHIRKLSDLKSKRRKDLPKWKRVMIAMNRKTLVVCKKCHVAITNGENRKEWQTLNK